MSVKDTIERYEAVMSDVKAASAEWMWEIMKEARDQLAKRPAWDLEMMRSAPRMYPSLREKEGPAEGTTSWQARPLSPERGGTQ